MARIPAVCDNCGTVFPSPIELKNSRGVRFVDCGAGPCPKCGGNGTILDGVYDTLGNTVRILLTSKRSVQELESLRHALKTAKEQKASREEITDTIKTHAPELQTLADLLPQKRSELYPFVSMLVVILATLIAAYVAFQKKGPTDAEINAMIEKAVAEVTQQQAPVLPRPMNRAQRRAHGRPLRPTRHK